MHENRLDLTSFHHFLSENSDTTFYDEMANMTDSRKKQTVSGLPTPPPTPGDEEKRFAQFTDGSPTGIQEVPSCEYTNYQFNKGFFANAISIHESSFSRPQLREATSVYSTENNNTSTCLYSATVSTTAEHAFSHTHHPPPPYPSPPPPTSQFGNPTDVKPITTLENTMVWPHVTTQQQTFQQSQQFTPPAYTPPARLRHQTAFDFPATTAEFTTTADNQYPHQQQAGYSQPPYNPHHAAYAPSMYGAPSYYHRSHLYHPYAHPSHHQPQYSDMHAARFQRRSQGQYYQQLAYENMRDSAESHASAEPELSRATHNVLERQRRNELKSRFSSLRDEIPEIRYNDKAPKIQILKRGLEYVNELRAAEQKLLADLELEKQRKNILLQRLDQLRGKSSKQQSD